MKSVIINADDFGLSPGVNRGIVECFRDGVLTSTTLMANMPAFDDAVALASANPDLPVGVHLSLLWGRPISDPEEVPSLVRRDGTFLDSAGHLAARYYLGRLDAGDIETEFRSQVRKVIDAGVTPTHFDTHKHIHALPRVRRALIAVAREFEVANVRLPEERCRALRGGPPHAKSRPAVLKRAVLAVLCAHARREIEAAGLRTSDHFVGVAHSACLDAETLGFILDHLEDGVTEIMCHPGHVDDGLRRFASPPPQREVELKALTDTAIKARFDAGTLRRIHYGES